MAKKKRKKQKKERGWLVERRQVDLWLNKAAEHLIREDYGQTIQLCHRILRYVPRQAKQRSEAMDRLSTAYAMQQRFDEAYAILSELVTLTPDEAHVWYNLGLACLYTQRYAESTPNLEHALALETNPKLIADYTETLADSRRMAEHERALRGPDFTLEQLAKQEDLYQKAVQLMEAQKWVEAEAAFRRVIEMGDCLPQPWGNVGSCLVMQGRFDEAEPALLRALEINPEYQLAQENLNHLEKIRVTGELPEMHVTKPFKEQRPNLSVKFIE